MSTATALMEQAQAYSPVTLIGFMTVAMILALVIIALSARVVRGLSSARELESALLRVQDIESKLDLMMDEAENMRAEYDRALAEEKEAHAREVFSLQQSIFERNSEILDLKTDLLELSKNYGNYHYDTLPQ